MADKEMHLGFVGIAMGVVDYQAQRVRAVVQFARIPLAEFPIKDGHVVAGKGFTEGTRIVADAVLQFIAGKGRCIGNAAHGDYAAHHFTRHWFVDRNFRLERIDITGVGGGLSNPMRLGPLAILRRRPILIRM